MAAEEAVLVTVVPVALHLVAVEKQLVEQSRVVELVLVAVEQRTEQSDTIEDTLHEDDAVDDEARVLVAF